MFPEVWIRAVRLSGDSCTDKISTDVFFEQAGSGPSGNDHCFSEIRTAGAGAGIVGDEVSPQQPVPPAGVGNRPEDKPKTEPHDTEISEEEKGKNGEGSRVGQGQASYYPHQQQHQYPPRPISHFYLISPGDNSASDATGAQSNNGTVPVWTPYAERAVSPTSYWTIEEEAFRWYRTWGHNGWRGLGGKFNRGNSQIPFSVKSRTANGSSNNSRRIIIMRAAPEGANGCGRNPVGVFRKVGGGKGMFNQPSFD